MGYDAIKQFKVDFKMLTIKGKSSPSNVRDWRDRKIVEPFKLTFENRDELEASLVGFANGCLDGTTQFPPSTTFAKRVNWLVENGYAKDRNAGTEFNWNYYRLPDTKEVREVLTGERKIKTSMYAIIVKSENSINGYNLVLKSTRSTISLSAIGRYKEKLTEKEIVALSKGTRKLSRLNRSQLQSIQENHKEWLERYNAEAIELT